MTEKKNPLALKYKLKESKDNLTSKLLYTPNMDINERKIYQEWLENINSLIQICEDRKRF